MKTSKILTALFILASFALNITSCASAAQAADLMKDISSSNQVNGKSAEDTFIASTAGFSIELFKKSITDKENSLISPLSVMLALAMTANGADNQTLVQMEQLLGGGITLTDLNEYLYTYVNGLPIEDKSKLCIANSIWFRDDSRLVVDSDFLQKNADYYNAYAYKSAFDAKTVQDINDWVKSNTDGMIDKVVDDINDDVMLYLINAVVFDAEWQEVYNEHNVQAGDFTDISGKMGQYDFMHSTEYKYLDDGKAAGFIKPYAGNHYSFAALLPNEDISIETYIESLTGTNFINTIKNAEDTTVYASMPKFEYEYEIKMNDALKALGMPDAFDSVKADLKKMAKAKDNLYIGEVLHKTYISVDELGTKAGAVTKVEILAEDAAPIEPKIVRLNRPFVYAIIDNATSLPVFVGTVMSLQ